MSFQNKLSVVISLLLNSGIYQKIENDVTSSTAYKGYFDILWTPQKIQSNKALTIEHLLPSFFALGLGLIPAGIAFVLEFFSRRQKVSNPSKQHGTKAYIPIMRQVPLELDINIAVNGRSWWRLRTKNGPFTVLILTSHSRGTCLIVSPLACRFRSWL